MALWLVRAGRDGEQESRFFDDNRIYFTWGMEDGLKIPKSDNLKEYKNAISIIFPERSPRSISNIAGQARRFAHCMRQGDWVCTPKKGKPIFCFGEITGDFESNVNAEYNQYRSVTWHHMDIPRDRFAKDIRNSFGARPTVCQISRNDIERRIKKLSQNNWIE